jgi:hypothetical protein
VKKQYSKRFITVRPEVMKGNGTLILNILLGLTLFIKYPASGKKTLYTK